MLRGKQYSYTKKIYFFNTHKLGYDVTTGTKYFVTLEVSTFLTKKCNVTVHSETLIGTTEYLTL